MQEIYTRNLQQCQGSHTSITSMMANLDMIEGKWGTIRIIVIITGNNNSKMLINNMWVLAFVGLSVIA